MFFGYSNLQYLSADSKQQPRAHSACEQPYRTPPACARSAGNFQSLRCLHPSQHKKKEQGARWAGGLLLIALVDLFLSTLLFLLVPGRFWCPPLVLSAPFDACSSFLPGNRKAYKVRSYPGQRQVQHDYDCPAKRLSTSQHSSHHDSPTSRNQAAPGLSLIPSCAPSHLEPPEQSPLFLTPAMDR